jgi:ribonuclease BN (tRNA processing enzyme)
MVIPRYYHARDDGDNGVHSEETKLTEATRSDAPVHPSAEDAGRVAQAAGVKTLVLSHLVPPDDPGVTEQMWIEAARLHFRGSVIVGRDLLEV